MSQTPEDRPRPPARPRPTSGARPSPRARVAGSRRDREEGVPAADLGDRKAPAAAGSGGGGAPAADAASGRDLRAHRRAGAARRTAGARSTGAAPSGRRSGRAPVAVLAALCLVAAAGAGTLLWQRLEPRYVDASVVEAAGDGVRALYAYDYADSEGSVEGKLAVLTGELREQYERDLSQGGIIDTYEQVSATTRYEVNDVGLQQINDAQDTATLVVFGQYVVESVNSGAQQPPEGSECQVTAEGAQSCVQTVQLRMVTVDGEWKISELTLLTTS
ncbi:hypothetical protein ABC795_15310 [Blastococcus sp. HT6-30]|uniref:hypothetical protein n=1 Tax=Blastococcus sp. HT6-30 TaxID=3144843 RepID=UPI00321C0DCE